MHGASLLPCASRRFGMNLASREKNMNEKTKKPSDLPQENSAARECSPGFPLGATWISPDACRFLVWAPRAGKVDVHIVSPDDRIVPMERIDQGYYSVVAENVPPHARYFYRLDGQTERPDPASRYQPEGVHGPSQPMDPSFPWEDADWRGLPLQDYVIYELHVGAFSPESTFDGIIPRLAELKRLGITAIELMPVAQFPGSRNWGYDGVFPYAVQNSYGGPAGLQRIVNACHRMRLAVILDVVYNHLGPEGNYLSSFAPYFTDRYATPWGEALNFDGQRSDEVRRFFIENAVRWITEFHIDALRLDAVHAIVDPSAYPFLEELGCAVHTTAESLDRHVYVMPESDRNDARLVRPRQQGGYGLDAVWSDDFHHALHVLLTGERTGYYEDFAGIGDLVRAYRDGFVYAGRYSAHRMRRHGNSAALVPGSALVVFSQNHDQVGNRMLGERLSQLVDFECIKLAAGAVILSPFLPLLFMGEEYGETAPFQYFVSHGDAQLVEAVRKGRREEFSRFAWQGEMPDPQAEETFVRARLDWNLRTQGRHRILHDFYAELLRLRREHPPLARLDRSALDVNVALGATVIFLRRWCEDRQAVAVFNFGSTEVKVTAPMPAGKWRKLLDSAETRWEGGGSRIPDSIAGDGHPALTISPTSFSLLLNETGN
jgi:maltooligosyltrehalose trehalohydrolase